MKRSSPPSANTYVSSTARVESPALRFLAEVATEPFLPKAASEVEDYAVKRHREDITSATEQLEKSTLRLAALEQERTALLETGIGISEQIILELDCKISFQELEVSIDQATVFEAEFEAGQHPECAVRPRTVQELDIERAERRGDRPTGVNTRPPTPV